MLKNNDDNFNNKIMKVAIKEANKNLLTKFKDGGPFGAVIVKDNKIIARAHNTVLKSKDPTAHAEVNTIRKACKKLNTYDLEGCILYTSAQPCPMCLSAIIWSNIKEVYYANTKEAANEIGFRDDIIYDFIKGKNTNLIKLYNLKSEEAKYTFEEFKKCQEKIIY